MGSKTCLGQLIHPRLIAEFTLLLPKLNMMAPYMRASDGAEGVQLSETLGKASINPFAVWLACAQVGISSKDQPLWLNFPFGFTTEDELLGFVRSSGDQGSAEAVMESTMMKLVERVEAGPMHSIAGMALGSLAGKMPNAEVLYAGLSFVAAVTENVELSMAWFAGMAPDAMANARRKAIAFSKIGAMFYAPDGEEPGEFVKILMEHGGGFKTKQSMADAGVPVALFNAEHGLAMKAAKMDDPFVELDIEQRSKATVAILKYELEMPDEMIPEDMDGTQ